MKKLSLIFAMLLLIVAGCSSNDGNNNEAENDAAANTENVENNDADEEGVSVDKGLLSTTISVPLELYTFGEELSDEDIDALKEELEDEGGKDIELDGDMITFKISNKDHKALLKETSDAIEETFTEFIQDEDLASILNIEANKDYTEVKVFVDQDIYENSFDSFAMLGIGFSTSMYHVFAGEDLEKVNTIIHIIDDASGEEVDTIDFGKTLEEMGASIED